MHPRLFQVSLSTHVVELKLKLALTLIVHERRRSTSADPIFSRCLDPHRCENTTDYDAK